MLSPDDPRIADRLQLAGDATGGGSFVRTTDAFFDRDDRGAEAASARSGH